MNGPADGVGFKLAIEPGCHLVNLGQICLDGRMVLGADDAVVRCVQVHEIVVLHVEGTSGGTTVDANTESNFFLTSLLEYNCFTMVC